MRDPLIPVCQHQHIILSCPHEDCVEQNEYLAAQEKLLKAYELSLREFWKK